MLSRWRALADATLGAIRHPRRAAVLLDWKDRFRGQRCFVLGTAPSLAEHDLTKLDGEWFFTVNRGYRARALGLPDIPFHVIADADRSWPKARPGLEAQPIGTYFVRDTVAARPDFHLDRARTVIVPTYRGGLRKRGFRRNLWLGLGNDTSVIVFAAQLAYWMGFSEVYVTGVELDYAQEQTYFFAPGQTETNVTTRPSAAMYAEDFRILREGYGRAGRRLVNLGSKGDLMGLPRADYDRVLGSRSGR
jgi:hypothetical protein